MVCTYFNADFLLNKRNELKMMIGEENPLVIRVTEMVPKNYKLHTQEIGIENYKCFVNLKSAKRGVCIYTHKSLGAIECREITNAEGVESVKLK